MTKLEAMIQPSKLDAVKSALLEIGIDGSDGPGSTRPRPPEGPHGVLPRAGIYGRPPAKIKLEIVLRDEVVEQAVAAVIKAAQTGKIGDGKIFLIRVDEAIRIRNEERGNNAL